MSIGLEASLDNSHSPGYLLKKETEFLFRIKAREMAPGRSVIAP